MMSAVIVAFIGFLLTIDFAVTQQVCLKPELNHSIIERCGSNGFYWNNVSGGSITSTLYESHESTEADCLSLCEVKTFCTTVQYTSSQKLCTLSDASYRQSRLISYQFNIFVTDCCGRSI
ncbi:hypothetical protein EG68_09035 [Paragonimus skrjabini miyazakii]|uniref:Apple domain-containing protein n=1 Tax=Paragonimus skrjabini miyazakii TaxID=59628 RepID=A0A8S9YJ20_9TREM|nr:hypothetical protein EG68_09035 [Paragonimus skrjabini miyazakii]